MLHRLLPMMLLVAVPALAATAEEEAKALIERAGEMEIRLPSPAAEAQAAAEETFRLFRSPANQERLAAERFRLEKEVFGRGSAPEPDPTTHAAGPGRLAPDERIYVFISASLPPETLRRYAAALERAAEPNMALVLRGFVGGAGRIGPTADFVADILREDPDCDSGRGEACRTRNVPVLVDPLLFRRFRITQVPAVVYARGVSAIDPGQSEGRPENAAVGVHFIVYGDAGLPYLLEVIQRVADSPGLAALTRGPLRRTR